MKTYFALILYCFACFSFAQDKQQNGLELTISVEKNEVNFAARELPKVIVKVTNHKADTIIIVKPGDGSSNGWITPFILWSVVDLAMKNSHPKKLDESDLQKIPGCGTITPLKEEDVVAIPPFGKCEWNMTFNLTKRPGKYSVKLLYRNIPNPKWKYGRPSHKVVDMIKSKSKEITLISNELVFTIPAE